MRVLVTGATGGLAPAVLEEFSRIPGASLVASGRRESARESYVACDLRDRESIRSLVGKVRPTLILHLAGSFENDFDVDLAVNALSARHLLDACREAGLGTRTVLLGSAAEYGLVRPGDNPVAETQPLQPVSIYGLTKAMQSTLAGYFAHALGADVLVARLFNVTGSGFSPRLFVGRAERLIAQYVRGEISRLEFGNLDSQRDYISAEDAARLLRLVAERGAAGEAYNLGSGRPTRMRELLERMLSDAGIDPTAVREQRTVPGAAQRVDVPCIYADIRKLRALEAGNGQASGRPDAVPGTG